MNMDDIMWIASDTRMLKLDDKTLMASPEQLEHFAAVVASIARDECVDVLMQHARALPDTDPEKKAVTRLAWRLSALGNVEGGARGQHD
jgi:hypothetical protein